MNFLKTVVWVGDKVIVSLDARISFLRSVYRLQNQSQAALHSKGSKLYS